MTSGVLFALAIGALVIAVLWGLVKRSRGGPQGDNGAAEGSQWTEGETTRAPQVFEVSA